jgi:CRISPR-associated endonuclease Cas1
MQDQGIAPRNGAAVVHGYGIKIYVRGRHLVVHDGICDERRTRRFHRVTGRVKRLVLIGHTGYITLDALRWLRDTGAALVHIDADGQLITTSAAGGPDLAPLRRAQALAAANTVGLEVARHLLHAKVAGQGKVLAELPHAGDSRETVQRMLDAIKTAATLDVLLGVEAQAAAAYWNAWAPVEIRLAPRDARKLPEHWHTFGQRSSLITGGPRTASNPANAILNYLYALLEAETILACHTVGLDPGLGIFHQDRRDRASLALDLMEAVRPSVDAYLLALLTQRTRSPRELVETREGACRITAKLAEQLADTCTVWRSQIAPVVEWTANTINKHSSSRVPTRSPLTHAHHRAAWDERAPDRKRRQRRADFAKLPNTCRECGTPQSDGRRRFCPECQEQRFLEQGPAARERASEVLARLRAEHRDPAHGGRAAGLRGSKNAAHQAAVRAWAGERPDPEVFRVEILPELRHKPIGELMAATGLSEHYCSLIRLGKRVPHARHWQALRRLVS